MRIIGGKLKGSSLHIAKSLNTRPLKDIVRESIFNLLIHSNQILFDFEKANILDLYSGTGSFGLECLSRESNSVYFVENTNETIKILEKNIEKLNLKRKTKIFIGDVFEEVERREIATSKFDLIFCDPPFNHKDTNKLIELIFKKNLLNKKGIIIIHRNKEVIEKFPDYFNIIDERVYGISKIIFGKFLF